MPSGTSEAQFENEKVSIVRWTFESGQETGVHRHDHDYVVVPLSDGEFEIVPSGNGEPMRFEMMAGEPYFRDAGVEHNIVYVGQGRVSFVEIELLA